MCVCVGGGGGGGVEEGGGRWYQELTRQVAGVPMDGGGGG